MTRGVLFALPFCLQTQKQGRAVHLEKDFRKGRAADRHQCGGAQCQRCNGKETGFFS